VADDLEASPPLSGDGTWDRILAELLTVADARGEVDWSVSVDSTVNRRTSTAPTFPAPQGAPSNYMNLFAEPEDHAIGRSRGGLSTKIHALVDGNGRPLVLLVAPGQGGDAPMFTHLMDQLKINRAGPGRPRTRPDRLRGDKAYSSRAIRSHLRDRGITAVIPQPSDQIGHRKRRGSVGGRPPAFDKEDYKGRNVVERNFNIFKQWRALATHLPRRCRSPSNQHLADSFRRHGLAAELLQPFGAGVGFFAGPGLNGGSLTGFPGYSIFGHGIFAYGVSR
jgi:putative transposase